MGRVAGENEVQGIRTAKIQPVFFSRMRLAARFDRSIHPEGSGRRIDESMSFLFIPQSFFPSFGSGRPLAKPDDRTNLPSAYPPALFSMFHGHATLLLVEASMRIRLSTYQSKLI